MKNTAKEQLRREYMKVWASPKMVDYCTNKAFDFAQLPGGEVVPIEKKPIEKDFCFGESGFDYDEAASMAAHARTSEEYFKRENMKHFNEWLKDLTEALENTGNYMLVIYPKAYTGQPDNCALASVSFFHISKILDLCGGSACLEELPGRVLDNYGQKIRIATREEITAIIEIYKEAAADHQKKIEKYLKRYGLTKVNSWTYWRDA